MLSRLRTARISWHGIARISMVLMLALALLSGLIPSGALSAAHLCRMACCASKPAHEAGACEAFSISAEHPEEAQVEAESPPLEAEADAVEHSSEHAHMEMDGATVETMTETVASADHCRTAQSSNSSKPVSAPRPASSSGPPQRDGTRPEQSSFAAQAFDRPCSMECAAAVLSLSQGRRPREAAALAAAARPRPPTLITRADSFKLLLSSSIELLRQSRPRSPPSSLVKLSA